MYQRHVGVSTARYVKLLSLTPLTNCLPSSPMTVFVSYYARDWLVLWETYHASGI